MAVPVLSHTFQPKSLIIARTKEAHPMDAASMSHSAHKLAPVPPATGEARHATPSFRFVTEAPDRSAGQRVRPAPYLIAGRRSSDDAHGLAGGPPAGLRRDRDGDGRPWAPGGRGAPAARSRHHRHLDARHQWHRGHTPAADV